MSAAQFLNLAHLEDVLDNDPDNIDQLQYWYAQLLEVGFERTSRRSAGCLVRT